MCDAMRLALAIRGKSESQGGLNIPALRQCASERGIRVEGLSRKALEQALSGGALEFPPRPTVPEAYISRSVAPRPTSSHRSKKAVSRPIPATLVLPMRSIQPKSLKYVKKDRSISARSGDQRLSAGYYAREIPNARFGDRCNIRKDGEYKCLRQRSNGSPWWASCTPFKNAECEDCSPRCADPNFS